GAPRRRLARDAPERRRRLGRDGRVVRRRVARRAGRQHAVADGVGGARAARRRRPVVARRRARHRVALSHARTGRYVGGAALHRHRLPGPLLPSLPPLPALLSPYGTRPVPDEARRARFGVTVGIERLAVYVPACALPLADLARARGVPPEKMTQGLG